MAVAAQSLPKRAAIYVRVSSPKQEDNFSLSSQEKSCREYAAERGYVVLEEHVYREVFSAEDIWDRPKLTRLRGAIEHELVDIVIAHEPKRLSRDPDDTIFLAVEARRRGVQYELATRPPDNSPYAGLIRYLDGLQGMNERLDMIERAGRGRRERVEAGLPMPGGKPPYGYRWKPDIVLPGRKRRTPKPGWDEDPETSWVVKRIFEEAARGHGQRRIAEGLNRDGIPPRREARSGTSPASAASSTTLRMGARPPRGVSKP